MKKEIVEKQGSIVFVEGKKIVTNSLLIAREYKKQHKNVIRKIEKAIERCKRFEISGLIFELSDYIDERGKVQRKYLLNRDAYIEVAVTFTGDRAFQLRAVFIKAFNKYEDFYKYHNNDPKRLEARQTGVLTRKEQTDVIKRFVEYAILQGSKSAQLYYMNLTKMENKALFFIEQKFLNVREQLNANQLLSIGTADHVIEKALLDGMELEMHYKDIYKLAKERIKILVSVVGKTDVPQFQIEHNTPKQIELFA